MIHYLQVQKHQRILYLFLFFLYESLIRKVPKDKGAMQAENRVQTVVTETPRPSSY